MKSENQDKGIGNGVDDDDDDEVIEKEMKALLYKEMECL